MHRNLEAQSRKRDAIVHSSNLHVNHKFLNILIQHCSFYCVWCRFWRTHPTRWNYPNFSQKRKRFSYDSKCNKDKKYDRHNYINPPSWIQMLDHLICNFLRPFNRFSIWFFISLCTTVTILCIPYPNKSTHH